MMMAQALNGGIPWVLSTCHLCASLDPDSVYTIRAGYAYSSRGKELTNPYTGYAAEAPRWIAGALEAMHRLKAHPKEPLTYEDRDGSVFSYYQDSLDRYEASSAVLKRGEQGLVTVTTHPGVYGLASNAVRANGGNPEDEGPPPEASTSWDDIDAPVFETQKVATYWLSKEPLDQTAAAYARMRREAYAERDRQDAKVRTERPT